MGRLAYLKLRGRARGCGDQSPRSGLQPYRARLLGDRRLGNLTITLASGLKIRFVRFSTRRPRPVACDALCFSTHAKEDVQKFQDTQSFTLKTSGAYALVIEHIRYRCEQWMLLMFV
jgi:hypothetical protein